jgi:hypothetical protein
MISNKKVKKNINSTTKKMYTDIKKDAVDFVAK